MAKLSPEERAALQKQLDDDDVADDDFEVEIEDNGRRARLPYSKAKKWVQETFGLDIAEETGEEPEDEDKPARKLKAAEEPRRFGGRRVS